MVPHLPVFTITCSHCGATADGNSREADGWTITKPVLCSICNGSKALRVWFIPAEEPGKYLKQSQPKGD